MMVLHSEKPQHENITDRHWLFVYKHSKIQNTAYYCHQLRFRASSHHNVHIISRKPSSSIRIQHHNLRFRASYTLHNKLIPGIQPFNIGAVALSQHDFLLPL